MDLKKTLEAQFQTHQPPRSVRGEIHEPGDSYWYHRPTLDFPPRTVRDPADYGGGERLSLGITQTGLPAAQQKALVRRWCELLPTLSGVRTLWFHSKVTQEMFEAACAMPGLEGLYVKWSGITSLRPLTGQANLAYFHLGGAPSAEHLDALATLPRLVDLEICNVRAAGDLRFLHDLPRLRALMLAGDSNSIKALKIGTLAPLATLQELERLTLMTVQVDDGLLSPLAGLPRLKHLRLPNRFPMEEFARLAGRRPDIQCDSFEPVAGPVNWLTCKICRRKSMHQLIGKGKPWLCEHCDAARLAKHIADFKAIAAMAAA